MVFDILAKKEKGWNIIIFTQSALLLSYGSFVSRDRAVPVAVGLPTILLYSAANAARVEPASLKE